MKLLLISVALCASATVASGCDRKPAEPATQSRTGAKEQGLSSQGQPKRPKDVAQQPRADEAFRLPANDRIVAIGDLHGDFSATERAFRLAGAIDSNGKWAKY